VVDVAAIYADLILKGLWTLEQVPERWRGEVAALLDDI
jgi:hypothetical protein